MFTIDNDMTINVTRGDCGKMDVSATVDDAVYVFSPGDILRLKVFEKKNCENVVLKKDFGIEVNATTVTLTLTGKDTKFGEIINKPTNYWYEIELNPETNPQTIVGYDDDGPKLFCLHPEGNEVEETEPDETDVGAFDDKLDLTSNKALPNWLVAKEILAIKGEIKKTGDNTVYVSSFGAKGDGVTDDREAIEQAIAALTDNSTFVFPKGHYVISSFPEDFEGTYKSGYNNDRYWFFDVRDKKNITIDLNDSIIELKVPGLLPDGNSFPRYSIFLFEDCKNFVLKNGTIIGDRRTHNCSKPDKYNQGDWHEWGYGVKIYNTSSDENVCSGTLKNLKIADCTGEGINIYNGNKYGPVNVIDCEISKCRRHGVTIGDSNNVTIDGCYIHHIGTFDGVSHRTSCGMGIDIEAEGGNYAVGSVMIKNTTIENTDGYNICCSSIKSNGGYTVKDICVENCNLTGVIYFRAYTTKEAKENGGYYYTPVIIKNSIINHHYFYESAEDKEVSNYTNKAHNITNGQMINCIINSCEDEAYYTKTTTYSIISSATKLNNCTINLLTKYAQLRYVALNSCTINGGTISSIEQSDGNQSLTQCHNVVFNGCGFQVVNPLQKYKYSNCSFIDCYLRDDLSNSNNGKYIGGTEIWDKTVLMGLALRNCYLNTDFLYINKDGVRVDLADYVNCTIEDEIEV